MSYPSASTQGTHGSGPPPPDRRELRARSSHQAPEPIPNPRVRVHPRPSSPSPAPPAYWPLDPPDTATSPRGHRETPCAIHGSGSCPYPVAQWSSVLSSPSPREGEEGVADVEGVVEVAVAEEEDDDDNEQVEVISVPASLPRRPAYKQTPRIRINPRGRPIRTLALRTGAREADWISPATRSEVWPPPPPPPPGGAVRNEPPPPPPTVVMTPPPPLHQQHTTLPPLLSLVGGCILHRFAHLANLAAWVDDRELGNSRTGHECHIEGVGV
jgi:hypothetical protein